jgi:four helix bundle protein
MTLVTGTYVLTRGYPRDERHALTGQTRRAAVSVAANIAEGHGRAHRREFLQFLAIAHASLVELETHLTIAHRVGYLDSEAYTAADSLCGQVSRMLTTMRARLGDERLRRAGRSTPDARRSTDRP